MMPSTTSTFPFLAFALLLGACASSSTPKPLTTLPPPAFASTPTSAADAPPTDGDIQFTVSDPKAKAVPADDTLSTLAPQKASTQGVKTQHIHSAQ
jgi:hypothetical protein